MIQSLHDNASQTIKGRIPCGCVIISDILSAGCTYHNNTPQMICIHVRMVEKTTLQYSDNAIFSVRMTKQDSNINIIFMNAQATQKVNKVVAITYVPITSYWPDQVSISQFDVDLVVEVAEVRVRSPTEFV